MQRPEGENVSNSIIHNSQRSGSNPKFYQLVNEQNVYIHTIEYYSAKLGRVVTPAKRG